MTTTITYTFDLNQDDFECIIEMAGYGIGYWASAARIKSSGCGGFYVGYDVTEDETEKVFKLDRLAVEKAVAELFQKRPLNAAFMQGIDTLIRQDDASDVDANSADAIVQWACFGEVIYG